jgi:hypothetical protein
LGGETLDIAVTHRGMETVIEQVDGQETDVIERTVEAPIWGMPPLDHENGHEKCNPCL